MLELTALPEGSAHLPSPAWGLVVAPYHQLTIQHNPDCDQESSKLEHQLRCLSPV